VRRIIERCPRQRHTSLFSATIPPEIETLIQWAMKQPQTVVIGARRSPAETVKHVVYPVAEAQKMGIAAFIDAEHALDLNYAERLGVKVEDLLVSQPDTGEQALEIAARDEADPQVKTEIQAALKIK
jgi:superfamily II DNA/RNA helicase